VPELQLTPGTCGMCGCTEEKPCEGGCSWADPARTLCTKCYESPGFTVSKAALELAMSVAQVQRALYAFEESWSRMNPNAEPDPFDMAYADAARLYGYLVEMVDELLEPFPNSRALAQSERRIVKP